MNRNRTAEQDSICKAVKELCEKELNSNVFMEDRDAVFPTEKWKKIADAGILGLPFDEKYGGLEEDMYTTASAIQTLARYCLDEGLVFSVCAHIAACQIPIWLYGTEQQKTEYLEPLIYGRKIGSSVMSEPDAGSDAGSIRTSISKEQDGSWHINGVKTFATLAPVADLILVYAKHKKGLKMLDISAVVLERGEFQIGQVFDKTGLRTSPMSEVILEFVKLPKERMLGTERRAMDIFHTAMLWEKILVSAYHVGAMEQQYSQIYVYATQRKQFGCKIIEFEGVYSRLTDIRIRIETSRLMLYQICGEFDRKEMSGYRAAMLKLHTADCKIKNSLDAVHIMGAYGIIKESMTEKQMRDSLAANIYSGTAEIQKLILSRNLGD